VYNVTDGGPTSSSAFSPLRGNMSPDAEGVPVTLRITVDQYGGVWMPTAGALSEVRFEGDRAEELRRGTYVTLRLTSAMYHRFHAPQDCEVEHLTYLSGDTWNVNPIALARVEQLFCRNERAVLRLRLKDSGHTIALVPVAAILVASIRLHFLDVLLHMRYRGSAEIACSARFTKGQEMGWFQHGSTILVFAPPGFSLCDGITPGQHIRMGQALMQLGRRG
ncbi:MAG TPA: phosphatidylserine decarboxylase, partial [Phycisphaerae bacterium]|nr:phosphatidylserine decarboxylase [Phycisphaerae bacterium]